MATKVTTLLPNAAASQPTHWVPRWGKHVSQWLQLADGSWSGGNGCAEATITRALLEYDPTTPARAAIADWDKVRRAQDPHSGYTATDLMNDVSLLARNQPLGPNAPETWDAPGAYGLGIEGTLAHFGLAWTAHYVSGEGFATAWEAALDAPLSILWVDGSRLSGAYQSDGYFAGLGGKGNHIVLWLPSADGSTLGLVNDPLADWPNRESDLAYGITMLRSAFFGCWVIPTPESAHAPVYTINQNCDLKQAANHLPGTVERLLAGTAVTFTGERVHEWAGVVAPDHQAGYVLWDNLVIS